MMPSRGLQGLRGIAPRAVQVHHRSFSSARRALPHISLRAATLRKCSLAASWSIGGPASARNLSWQSFNPFASTPTTEPSPKIEPPIQTVSEPATVTPEVASPSATSTNIPNLDTVDLGDIDFTTSLAGIEKIGYLKELGIEYNYGIRASLEWLVEHYHIWGGMPWWAAIAATAVTIRVMTIPLTIKASDAQARERALRPAMQPFQQRLKEAQLGGNKELVQIEYRKYLHARKEAGLSFFAMLGGPLVQGVVGFCGFALVRAMVALPVPGLRDGGFLWITDLTIPDGYLILPAFMALSVHVMARFGGESGATQLASGMKAFMLWGVPGIIFLITGWQSAALAVWFTASGAISMGTAMLLRQEAVRKMLGITPLYDMEPAPPPAVSQAFGVPLTTTAATAAASSTAAPRSSYTRPTYQAPTVRQARDASKVIDTTLTHKPSTAPVDTAASKPGILDSIKSQAKSVMAQGETFSNNRMEKNKRKRRQEAADRAVEDRKNRAKR